MTDSQSRGLVKVGHLIHVMIRAGINDAGCPGNSAALDLGRDKAPCIIRYLLLNGAVEIQERLNLSGLLLLKLILIL